MIHIHMSNLIVCEQTNEHYKISRLTAHNQLFLFLSCKKAAFVRSGIVIYLVFLVKKRRRVTKSATNFPFVAPLTDWNLQKKKLSSVYNYQIIQLSRASSPPFFSHTISLYFFFSLKYSSVNLAIM